MPLTNTAIKAQKTLAEAGEAFRPGRAISVRVTAWRQVVAPEGPIRGKEKLLSLGTCPDTSLAMAREKRDVARRLLARGIDPSAHKHGAKAARQNADSFEALAREWFAKFSPRWVPNHADKIIRRLDRDVFPWIGSEPVGEVTAPKLLATMRRIEHRGVVETAHRALQNCGQVFRYAVATGRAERDPSGDLRGALPPVAPRHHASVTDAQAIGQLLRDIRAYEGSFVTRYALLLAPIVFVRPSELRNAEWAEVDLDAAEWRIAAARMKSRAIHVVPLSPPSRPRLTRTPRSDRTRRGKVPVPGSPVEQAADERKHRQRSLAAACYDKDMMTGHGFRSTASTRPQRAGMERRRDRAAARARGAQWSASGL